MLAPASACRYCRCVSARSASAARTLPRYWKPPGMPPPARCSPLPVSNSNALWFRTERPSRVWAENPSTGKRRDLGLEEERAFWTRAVVEVLRATGIRIEELLALSHHSLVQYRLPTTGELVPLLQIVPSKTDTERLLLVSPELADVLSAIICRAREATGAVPLVRSYDRRECAWQEPAPLLFQRRIRGEDCALSRRGNPGAHGLPRPPPVPPPERGIPRSHRRGMARVPRPLRAAQSLHRSMRPRVRHPLHSRTCLRPLPDAVARPRPA